MLALLWDRKGERFVTLMRALGASQKATRETLDALLAAGMVMRNPGYGHPLRPEYVLTEAGVRVGEACSALDGLAREIGFRSLFRSKWSLRAVKALSSGPLRFGELRAALAPVTDRALILCLKGLLESQVVERAVESSFPPVARYGLSAQARKLLRPLGLLLAQL
jgi:DNA-binding HxlR family transcriptional regulator